MRVLIGYESSGMMREAFRALGHDAWSCDLQPADDGSCYHYQSDIWEIAARNWDMAIFHPPCTYLTISAAWAFTDGPYHQKVKPETLVGQARRDARESALDDVRRLMSLPYPLAMTPAKQHACGSIGSRPSRRPTASRGALLNGLAGLASQSKGGPTKPTAAKTKKHRPKSDGSPEAKASRESVTPQRANGATRNSKGYSHDHFHQLAGRHAIGWLNRN